MHTALKGVPTLSHLQPLSNLMCCRLHAVDGEIGKVEALYFEDASWKVRYLLVDTGDWLAGRRLLISPVAVGEVREDEKRIYIELTRRQIGNSPPLDAEQPVSRCYEEEYYQYYDWPLYWDEDRPSSGVVQSSYSLASEPFAGREARVQHKEMHLQITTRVNGCVILAQDGAFGLVRDLIVDTRYWMIRYLAVDAHRGHPGRHALVSPGWIERVNWGDRLMNIGLASRAIESAPSFDPCSGISRDYETRLFRHYGRRAYWQRSNGTN
jgi:hypothetical protein